jgi:hypothetical protein
MADTLDRPPSRRSAPSLKTSLDLRERPGGSRRDPAVTTIAGYGDHSLSLPNSRCSLADRSAHRGMVHVRVDVVEARTLVPECHTHGVRCWPCCVLGVKVICHGVFPIFPAATRPGVEPGVSEWWVSAA